MLRGEGTRARLLPLHMPFSADWTWGSLVKSQERLEGAAAVNAGEGRRAELWWQGVSPRSTLALVPLPLCFVP